MILRWSTPNDDSIYTKSYLENSAGVATTYDQLVHIDVTLDDLHRWKDVDFSVSFNTSAGFSPWSDSVRVSKVSNRKIIVCVYTYTFMHVTGNKLRHPWQKLFVNAYTVQYLIAFLFYCTAV